MTYNVFGGTLNLTQPTWIANVDWIQKAYAVEVAVICKTKLAFNHLIPDFPSKSVPNPKLPLTHTKMNTE